MLFSNVPSPVIYKWTIWSGCQIVIKILYLLRYKDIESSKHLHAYHCSQFKFSVCIICVQSLVICERRRAIYSGKTFVSNVGKN